MDYVHTCNAHLKWLLAVSVMKNGIFKKEIGEPERCQRDVYASAGV